MWRTQILRFNEVLTEFVTLIYVHYEQKYLFPTHYMCMHMNILSMDVVVFSYTFWIYIFQSRPKTITYMMLVFFVVVESEFLVQACWKRSTGIYYNYLEKGMFCIPQCQQHLLILHIEMYLFLISFNLLCSTGIHRNFLSITELETPLGRLLVFLWGFWVHNMPEFLSIYLYFCVGYRIMLAYQFHVEFIQVLTYHFIPFLLLYVGFWFTIAYTRGFCLNKCGYTFPTNSCVCPSFMCELDV